jgi:hypothetical protein
MLQVNDPRKVGREAIRQSVPAELWLENEKFSRNLLRSVTTHSINRHPIIGQLETGKHELAAQRFFHLEFGHAFAQGFTDTLIQAMLTSVQLEPRLGALGKMSARFLLQLNVLDEMGFQPQAESGADYAGNPYLSHYLQFDATLRQLGITREDHARFVPSEAAAACRHTFTGHFPDHAPLTCVLAISETVFTNFCGPWAKSVGKSTNIDVTQGYHSIHVQHEGKFIDDDHAEDAWYVFMQAITPDRYDELHAKALSWLDTWEQFLNHLVYADLKGEVLEDVWL